MRVRGSKTGKEGERIEALFHLHLCWAWWSLSLPQQALWSLSLDPEISTLLCIISPPCLPRKYHQYSSALVVPKCQGGQFQMMQAHSLFDTWLYRKYTAYALVSARLCTAPTLSKLTLSHPNVHRIWPLVISSLFTVAVPHITQWLAHINSSIKVFCMNGWVQWELD